MSIRVWTYRFEPPGPLMSSTNDAKYSHAEIDATSADLIDYPLNHEVLGVIVYTDDRMYEGLSANAKFYNDDTERLLWDGSYTMPSPNSQGYEWWDWQKIKFWIGRI